MSVLWVSTFTVGIEIVPLAQLFDFSYMTSDIVTHSDFSPQYTRLGVLHLSPQRPFLPYWRLWQPPRWSASDFVSGLLV